MRSFSVGYIMRFLLFISLLLSSYAAFANQPLDLEANMKNMGLAYKQSVEAVNLEDFNHAIDEFIHLAKRSKTANFNQHKAESLQGLDKVITKAQLAKQLANEKSLDAAKGVLKSIDGLRKKYHELHEPPGFWELLFGR